MRRARLSVRQLTHTLHLPPALSEIYGGPNTFWLRDVLEYLPNLQSLIVSQLPFFDHQSLIALRYASGSRRSSLGNEEDRPQYDLKLLLAEREPNTTSAGLREALLHFPRLVYLDLSYTSPARDASVLSALANLWGLQVVKFRGIGMRDGEAEVLANAIGIRVRLLDLRENHLTDMAVRSLMQACFLPPDRFPGGGDMNTRHIEDWPVGMAPGPDFLSLDSLRSEDLDRELLKQLTHPLTGRLAFEDIPHKGLTHLYIADNNLSVEGLSSLLKSTRLHLLDGGSVDTVKTISRTKSLSSCSGYRDEIRFPGAEKLVPILGTYASHNLTYLRVDHAVVTKPTQIKESPSSTVSAVELPSKESALSAAELPSEGSGVVEAPAPAHYAIEMPTENQGIVELSAESAGPKVELPGDCIHFALSPPVNAAPVENNAKSGVGSNGISAVQPKRADGAFAPEVVSHNAASDGDDTGDEVVLNASGSGLSLRKRPATVTLPSEDTEITNLRHESLNDLSTGSVVFIPSPPLPSSARLALIEALLQKRPLNSTLKSTTPNPLQPDQSESSHQLYNYLHPSHLPNLRTLVLTGVPTHVPASSQTIPALLRFVSACADETYLARLRAQTDYSLPPGHSRYAAELQHARSLFALRTIILEMGDSKPSDTPTGKAWDHSRAKLNMLKSSTGDRDSEALWSAAENDFSFFGEEGEEKDECGIYENEPEKYFPSAIMDEKIAWDANEDGEGRNSSALRSPTVLSPATLRPLALLQSPRDLPLGRNRRSSSGASSKRRKESLTLRSDTSRPNAIEMPGTIPSPSHAAVSLPHPKEESKAEPMLDLVSSLSKFRKAKKAQYEDALLKRRINNRHNSSNALNHSVGMDIDVLFVDGYWAGNIKIVRNTLGAGPKGSRTGRTEGAVDMYGNYFEKGYLYP